MSPQADLPPSPLPGGYPELPPFLPGRYRALEHPAVGETVRDFMTARPVTCTASDTVAAAARQMILCDCGALPVVDRPHSYRLVGILTDGDILRRVVATDANPATTLVEQAMSRVVHAGRR
jgi:CBS domain-containing protein